ncbi:LOW QUALITY PROTEIN: pentatricopeptide repeat-containing protein 1, mitochondrial [Drosophila gunungcola]|uniref:LOW QUALITY PROTEIN: pentatricopeptide repeat-containing protein 1, mitochondrial n=1 Tax=Drosophila gunungcola TaxID=103775 RepID=UPI0022E3F48A|nr:LOW QUALITY PROTEIN: pentatricopeptide repeat-containing protein 1, mitochondrial [Drosophila gunungcola]
MALRLLSRSMALHMRGLQLNTTRRGLNSYYLSRPAVTPVSWSLAQNRLLHVRITDQEAGLQTKREANRNLNPFREEVLQEPSTEAPKQRHKFRPENKLKEKSPKKKLDFGDPDTFGGANINETQDPGDLEEEEFISNPTRRSKKLKAVEYARHIKDHLKANRLNEAIAVLEQRMLREDRVKPDKYIYNLLISGCAKAGYTRKAFALYTKMRQRGLQVTGGTYTSLFNACANAPSLGDGLAKAQILRENMLEKGYEPNVKNYNAMIKAYGRCGDVNTAYMLADEMAERQLELNADTFNFLLQACAGNPEHGFRHALLTWHKMLKSGISPDYYSFNTMLRCARDCGFGDLNSMQEVLYQIAPAATGQKPIPKLEEGENEKLPSITSASTSLPAQIEVSTTASELELPNLLLPRPHLGSLVALEDVTRPHERFLLLGGLVGFLEHMKEHKITPNIETFTTLLEVIPPTNAAEKQLLTFVRKIGLKADIDFFNILIKKRSMRFDYENAREVLTMIRTAGLRPDIVTYGVLALGCRTQEEARELLQQMQVAGIKMNMPILGAMLRQGCANKSFSYINEIIQLSLEEGIKPNESFLRHLHNFHRGCARAIDARHPSTKTAAFKKGHSKFCDKYRLYYEELGLAGLKLEDAIAKVKERPYQKYKEPAAEGMEPLKHEQLKRKTKIRKYIKKIKIDELQDDPPREPLKRIE